MFVLICHNKEGNIKLKSFELEKALEARKAGKPAIFENGVVLNWNMFAGIVEDKDAKEEIKQRCLLGETSEEAKTALELKDGLFLRAINGKSVDKRLIPKDV